MKGAFGTTARALNLYFYREEGTLEERLKASISAKVEHPCLDVKGRFGYAKVRCRGLAKNRERVALLLAFQPKEIPTLAAGRLTQGVVGPEPSRNPKKGW